MCKLAVAAVAAKQQQRGWCVWCCKEGALGSRGFSALRGHVGSMEHGLLRQHQNWFTGLGVSVTSHGNVTKVPDNCMVVQQATPPLSALLRCSYEGQNCTVSVVCLFCVTQLGQQEQQQHGHLLLALRPGCPDLLSQLQHWQGQLE